MTKVRRPKRWDKPFSKDMSDAIVTRVLSTKALSHLNAGNFSDSLPLSGIIANDTRIVYFKKGEVIVRKGEYGGSAFLTLSGDVAIIKNEVGLEIETKKPTGLFNFFKAAKSTRLLDFPLFTTHNKEEHLTLSPQFQHFIEQYPDNYITLEADSFYGEIAALARGTRTATVFSKTDTEILEIGWQGLRDLMRYDTQIREQVRALYKQHSLLVQLRNTKFLSHLKAEQLEQLNEQSLFENYGKFEWQRSFQKVKNDEDVNSTLKIEPIIAQQGDYVDGLLLISSGFARLSKTINHGEKTIGYLKQGDTFGFEELVHNWRTGEEIDYQHSLRAIGYVDIIRIPTSSIEKYAFAHIDEALLPTLINDHDNLDYDIDTGILEQLVEKRFINGSSTMVIDRHRCTGCDDCVSACASLHDGQARFNRNGAHIDKYAITHACMHCTDPVCLIGCPTGAIHRSGQLGNIIIDDNTCIGCSGCANSCPYENIIMREVFDDSGQALLDEQNGTPLLKASKCDLCIGHGSIPACEQACPHDALKRLDMGNIASFADWFNR